MKNWLNKNKIAVSVPALVILLAIDAYYFVLSLCGVIELLGYICWFTSVVFTIFYIVLIASLVRIKMIEKYLEKIWQELDTLYFHGFKVHRYLSSEAFLRLQAWLGCGMCYELSALAMLVLKHNKTARLCRGDYYEQDGKPRTCHGWVEFKIPLCGWCVADFSWIHGGFARKKVFFKSLDGGKLKERWSCSYDDFWDLPFPNVLYKAIQSSKTSKILFELTAFCGHTVEDGGFKEWCYSGQKLRYSDGTFMIPFLNNKGKPVSTIIIRDFVKNPKRKQPKAKSIRCSRLFIRHYSTWRSQQKVTYSESPQE